MLRDNCARRVRAGRASRPAVEHLDIPELQHLPDVFGFVWYVSYSIVPAKWVCFCAFYDRRVMQPEVAR
jgi:hypothetical protein